MEVLSTMEYSLGFVYKTLLHGTFQNPALYKMKFRLESVYPWLTAQKKLQNTFCCLNNSRSSLVLQI